MIRFEEEIARYTPINVAELEKKLGTIPDDMKGAIEMFNKALRDIGNGSEDMAVIALKKSVAMYPAFYEALNLMGLCHAHLGDMDKAAQSFTRVIQMDDSSIKASKYLEQLTGSGDASDAERRSRRVRAPKTFSPQLKQLANGLQPEAGTPFFLKYIAGFIAGVLVMGLIWLVIPGGKPLFAINRTANEGSQVQQLTKENTELSTQLQEANNALKLSNQKEADLRAEMEQVKIWTKKLQDLKNLADSGKYREVVVEIEKNLQGLNIPKDIEQDLIKLNNACKPKAAQQIYVAAKKAYDGNVRKKDKTTWQNVMKEMELAVTILDQLEKKPENAPEIYYYGGMSYALAQYPNPEEGNNQAIATFQKLINLGSKSKYTSKAAARINDINAGATIWP